MALLTVPPDTAVELGDGGATVASAAGASAVGGTESVGNSHKKFTRLERPCHSHVLKPKCITSRRSAHVGPVSLWTYCK